MPRKKLASTISEMSQSHASASLYDPRKGANAIRVADLTLVAKPTEPARTNCFSIYRIQAGHSQSWAEAAKHPFAAKSLLFLTWYQYIRFEPAVTVRGIAIEFHANSLRDLVTTTNMRTRSKCRDRFAQLIAEWVISFETDGELIR